MMTNNIIHYASGGLANRIKPLLSCWYLAEISKRNLFSCWPINSSCQALFSDLFEVPKIEYITQSNLANMEDVKIYAPENSATYECKTYGNCSLVKLFEKFNVASLYESIDCSKDINKNLVMFSNTSFPNIDNNVYKEYIKRLVPIIFIRNTINEFEKEYNINKSWIGVHVRATDFDYNGTTIDQYITNIKAIHKPNNKYFVCSDSQEAERIIQNTFPNVVFRNKESYTKKNDVNKIWNNNVLRDIKSCQEAIIDLYLLAKTGQIYYNKKSTFPDMAFLLQ